METSLVDLLTQSEERGELQGTGARPEKWIVESDEDLAEVCDEVAAWREYRPLAERGLLTWFDGEGDFFELGEHSRIISHVARRAGAKLDAVDDRWIPTVGWMARLRLRSGEELYLLARDEAEEASDYCDTDLLVASVNAALEHYGRKVRALSLETDDQSVMLAVVGVSISDEVRDRFGRTVGEERVSVVAPEDARSFF